MERCRPLHLPEESPSPSCPRKAFLPEHGYFQLCGFHFYFSPVDSSSSSSNSSSSRNCREDQRPIMEDQHDLISNHEQLPILSQRPRGQESKCSHGALYTGFSVLVALLLAGQATTAYFLYQQQGRLDKLTVTSQNLQLESLRMKLPKAPNPMSKLRVATPMLMQALPMKALSQESMQNATKYGNMTQDHVMHMLLRTDPLKTYPQLKGSFPENLKHLQRTMERMDWKIFESWMHQWLLFEMSKNSLEDKQPTEAPTKALTKCQEEVSRIPAIHPGVFMPKCDENGNYLPLQCFGSIGYCWCVFPNGTEVPHTRSRGRHNCSEPLDLEDQSSGLGVTKHEMGQDTLVPDSPSSSSTHESSAVQTINVGGYSAATLLKRKLG
ncbi:PREDICTED: LOW QUALITY PROTEIN: CD74 molecule, major histocompatibility complex, class II invariant chain [Chrysochloris asiatica]|uniref:Ia antigen-associated invariant chain n=1 Tax=Chrysochloris asiatica TaxID=185453 RepID=A0A9B0U7H5_CHRAS|nr:PREDICTED: LOW QUALITY PROTEIN: CD74 molecule, major histocompatibility complex, class II invariant chain [Chrysochloris asiatica]